MDVTASGDELRGAARLARESVVVDRAVTMARWIGTGRRPVTAAAVFVQRLFSAYLPPVPGWLSLMWMRRREYL